MVGSFEMEIFHLNHSKIFFKDMKSLYFLLYMIAFKIHFMIWQFLTLLHSWIPQEEFHTNYKKYRNLLSTLMKKSKQACFVKDNECMGMRLQGFKDLHCYGRMRTIGLVLEVLKWRYILTDDPELRREAKSYAAFVYTWRHCCRFRGKNFQLAKIKKNCCACVML